MRADHLTPEIAPNMYRLKQESISFQTTFGGASNSHHSGYSMFYSRPSYELVASTENQQLGSFPLNILKYSLGYRIFATSSSLVLCVNEPTKSYYPF